MAQGDYVPTTSPSPSIPQNLPYPRGYHTTSTGFSEWQLDPKDVLELVEHTLRGDIWDPTVKPGIWITVRSKIKVRRLIPISQGKGQPSVMREYESEIQDPRAKLINPLLSEEGIQDILRDLHTRIHRVTIMSNYTEKQICDILWDLGDNLAYKLSYNFQKWAIKTIVNMNSIHDIVMGPTESTIRRALNGLESKRLYEATKTTETREVITQRGGRGLLDWIPGIGGK